MRTWLLTAGLVPLLAGCPNPNSYGTPRTVAPGDVTHTIALDGLVQAVPSSICPPAAPGQPYPLGGCTSTRELHTYPNMPMYTARIGIARRVDVGIRLLDGSFVGVDAKLHFLRSRLFDVAVVPGADVSVVPVLWRGVTAAAYLRSPLLLGINLSDQFTIVLSGGVIALIGPFTSPYDAVPMFMQQHSEHTMSHVLVHAGLGLDLRTSASFAIHPEVSMTSVPAELVDAEDTRVVFAGVGFVFGKLPNYSDR